MKIEKQYKRKNVINFLFFDEDNKKYIVERYNISLGKVTQKRVFKDYKKSIDSYNKLNNFGVFKIK